MNDRKNKNYHIETLRGIAILLVVAGHVIGSTPAGGMKIDYPSIWRYIYSIIIYIQMPLFTAIAGWVYSIKPVSRNSMPVFLKKKVMRLLLPMITVGTLYFLIQYFTPGTNNKGVLSEIWRIYIFPYTIYWYLPSLFLMFIAIGFIDINNYASTFKSWFICFFISYFLLILFIINIIPESLPNLFSFKGAIYQFPYFLIGVFIYRFKDFLNNKFFITLCLVCTIIGIFMLNLSWFYPVNKYEIYKAIKVLFITSTLLVIFKIKFENDLFITFGKFAYSIYLFHVFFTGGIRIILLKCGVESNGVIFFTTFIIASLAPILIDKIMNRYRILSICMLGNY